MNITQQVFVNRVILQPFSCAASKVMFLASSSEAIWGHLLAVGLAGPWLSFCRILAIPPQLTWHVYVECPSHTTTTTFFFFPKGKVKHAYLNSELFIPIGLSELQALHQNTLPVGNKCGKNALK